MLWKAKASKDDSASNASAVENLRNKLDHALILIIECIKSNIIWYNDNKHSVINRNASVLQQLNNVYKWINNDYLKDTSIADQIDQISKFNADTRNTVLPEAANRLFGRRASQHNQVYRPPSLEVKIENKQQASRNKQLSTISSKPKTRLMRFNFNEGFNNFKSVGLCVPNSGKQIVINKSIEDSIVTRSNSNSKSPSNRKECQTMMNLTQMNIKTDFPKIETTQMSSRKHKILTSKIKNNIKRIEPNENNE